MASWEWQHIIKLLLYVIPYAKQCVYRCSTMGCLLAMQETDCLVLPLDCVNFQNLFLNVPTIFATITAIYICSLGSWETRSAGRWREAVLLRRQWGPPNRDGGRSRTAHVQDPVSMVTGSWPDPVEGLSTGPGKRRRVSDSSGLFCLIGSEKTIIPFSSTCKYLPSICHAASVALVPYISLPIDFQKDRNGKWLCAYSPLFCQECAVEYWLNAQYHGTTTYAYMYIGDKCAWLISIKMITYFNVYFDNTDQL